MQFSGVRISWLRYGEWLLTCPVILIHLSNLTGLGQYNKRTMRLLVSDIGTSECACRQRDFMATSTMACTAGSAAVSCS